MNSKRIKTLAILIIGILSSVLFVGCSCSKKDIKPVSITVDVTEKTLYVGDSVDINYSILPVDTTNTKVNVTMSSNNVVTDTTGKETKVLACNTTTFDGATGTLTVTAANISSQGDVTVTLTVAGTSLQANTVIKVIPDPIQLGAPRIDSNTFYDKSANIIQFPYVAHATKYIVDIDGVEYEVVDTNNTNAEHDVRLEVFTENIPLAYDVKHMVKVKSIGDGTIYTDSGFSDVCSFIKYSKVTNVTANNGLVTWDAHPIAKLYHIKIDGIRQTVMPSTNSYQFNPTDTVTHTIQVCAAFNSDKDENNNLIIASDYTDEYSICKLAQPQLSLFNQNNVNNEVTESLVKFEAVEGAASYKVSVSPSIGDVSEFEITNNFILIDSSYVVGTEYTITVTPVGDIAHTIIGQSNSIKFTRIGTVDGASISDNTLTFNAITDASSYAIIVKSDEDTKYTISTSPYLDLSEKIDVVGTYRIYIKALGVISEVINRANGDLYDTQLTFTKLDKVNASTVSNLGVITWQAVTDATSYNVFVDDNFLANTNECTYTLPIGEYEAGRHTVKIVAIGDGVRSITSGKAYADEIEFVKLAQVTNTYILNDTLYFDGVDNAINYSVKINDGEYTTIGNSGSVVQSYKINKNIVEGDNVIYILAEGEGVRYIRSNVVSITIPRLTRPTNIKVDNGNITWDKVEGYTYKIYIDADQEVYITEDNFVANLPITSGERVVRIKALSSERNILSSDFALKTIIKLESVDALSVRVQSIADDNVKSNYKLVWNAVNNAEKYSVVITKTDDAETTNTYSVIGTELVLPEDYVAGKYNVEITAIGNSENNVSESCYINANVTKTQFDKLGAPTNLTVVNGVLTWSNPSGQSPTSYKLGITYGNKAEQFVVVNNVNTYTFDTETYKLEDISVRIRALGDNTSLVTGDYCEPFVFSRSATIENFKIINGVITWTAKTDGNYSYIVYGTQTPEDENSYEILNVTLTTKEGVVYCTPIGLNAGVKYSIKVMVTCVNKLNSEFSSVLKVTKLNSVTDFKVVNKQFVWNAVDNATGYIIDDKTGNQVTVTSTSYSIEDFRTKMTVAGLYNFYIVAVGSQEESINGYINGSPATSCSVRLLNAPRNVVLNDNILKITNFGDGTITYRIEISDANNADADVHMLENIELDPLSNIVEINMSNLTSLPAGTYNIEVFSIGNNADILDSIQSFRLENIIKIDAESLNLRVQDGILRWDIASDQVYDLYIDGELLPSNTGLVDYNKASLNVIKGNSHTVGLVAHRSGYISSNPSEMVICRLPDVNNFSITAMAYASSDDEKMGKRDYYFQWSAFTVDSFDGVTSGDTNNFYFEIGIKDDASVPPFECKTDNGAETQKKFKYDQLESGEYYFFIQAKGKNTVTPVGGKKFGYINGEKSESIKITLLSSVSDVSYNRKTHKVEMTNNNTDATHVLVSFAYIDPKDTNVTTFKDYTINTVGATAQNFDLVYSSDFEEGDYIMYITPIGDIHNYVINAQAFAYNISIIKHVTNVRITNGYLNWSHAGGEGIKFEIYLDNKLVTYTTQEPDPNFQPDPENPDVTEAPLIDVVHENFADPTEARMVNDLINDTLMHEIKIRAIKEGCVDSAESNTLQFKKLPSIYNIEIKDSKLYWDNVENAEGYVIKLISGNMSELFEEYNPDYDGIYCAGKNAGSAGITIPTNLPSGSYGFYVVAVGTTGNEDVEPTEMQYMTGSQGSVAPVTVLGNANIYINKGIVNWDAIVNATDYKVDICKGETFDESNIISFLTSGVTKASLESSVYLDDTFYMVRIWAVGNGVTTLNTSVNEITSIKVYKPNKPTGFAVRDGYVSWQLKTTDEYIKYLNNGNDLDDNATNVLVNTATGKSTAEPILASNIEFYKNIEVTINNRLYKDQLVTKIEQDKNDKNTINYYYDFNFTKIKNPYEIKIRFLGNGTQSGAGDEPNKEEVMTLLDNPTLRLITANEDGKEGPTEPTDPTVPTEPTEPDPGESSLFITDVINVVNGSYTEVIIGHKLAIPQSPVVGIKTMVENDCLYFSKVSFSDASHEERYLITATDTAEGTKVEYIINETNKSQFKTSGDNTYRFPISTLGADVKPGTIYTLSVRALGTHDSTTIGNSTIYLTSNIGNTCEIERLQNPTVTIVDGNIAVTQIASAISQKIYIWSTSLGTKYDPEFDNEVNRSNNKYAKEITIGGDETEENPHSAFITINNGIVIYSLTDNGYFPVSGGPYYVTSKVFGNGVDKISSDTNTSRNLEFKKRDIVGQPEIYGGLFRWQILDKAVKRYNLTINQYLVDPENPDSLINPYKTDMLVIDVNNYADEKKEYIYFDLDSSMYPTYNEDKLMYKYEIKVFAMGQTDGEDPQAQGYVNGDSLTSGKYERLLPPEDIEMVQGKLTWKTVNEGVRYEVYLYDEELSTYSLAKEGRTLTFESPMLSPNNGIYIIRIRALPANIDTTYLNGGFCIEVQAKKLENPQLRVEGGILKWNSTDLSYVIATGVNIKISKLNADKTVDSVVYENTNLAIDESINTSEGYDLVKSLIDESLMESGLYKIEIGYNGSNGVVPNPSDPNDITKPSDTGNPDGGEEKLDNTDDTKNKDNLDNAGGKEDPDNPGDTGDPGNPDNPDTPTTPDVPQDPTPDGYCWFNSDIVTMEFVKLDTPEASLYIVEDDSNPENFVVVKRDNNAVYYRFTAVKYDESGNIIKSYTFEPFNVNTDGNEYITKENNVEGLGDIVKFNLKAVANNDALSPDQPHPFGETYSVYCQVYANDYTYDYTYSTIFSISNKSNEIAVEVPTTPTNLTVNTNTGVISWVNKSNNTMSMVEITYNGGEPVITKLDKGVNTCKLSTIGSFSVRVLNYITSVNGKRMCSAYTDAINGTFLIFDSGSGTETDPYILKESQHIINVNYYLNSHFKLANDISMTSTNMQYVTDYVIGKAGSGSQVEQPFNGVFDGNGHKISNIYYSNSTQNSAFFYKIGATGVVKNTTFTIKNSATTSYYTQKIFAVVAQVNNGNIEGVTTMGETDIVYMPMNQSQYISGMVYDNHGTIRNSINNINFKYRFTIGNMQTSVAGIAVNNNKIITQCGNKGLLQGNTVGGISAMNNGKITESYNTGDLTTHASGSRQGKAGGIAANNTTTIGGGSTGTIDYCYVVVTTITISIASDSSQTSYAGGLVASESTGAISNSYVYVANVVINNTDKAKYGSIIGISNVDSGRYSSAVILYADPTGNTYNPVGSDNTKKIGTKYESQDALKQGILSNGNLSTKFKSGNVSVNNGMPVLDWQTV